jgi:hypothetical protein
MLTKTPELLEQICELIADGKSLRSICAEGKMEKKTIMRWLRDDHEFQAAYAQARQHSADAMAEQLQDLAQEALASPERAQAVRVAADILKWTASKLKPKSYGERIEQHVIEEAASPAEVDSRIKALEEQLGIQQEEQQLAKQTERVH